MCVCVFGFVNMDGYTNWKQEGNIGEKSVVIHQLNNNSQLYI